MKKPFLILLATTALFVGVIAQSASAAPPGSAPVSLDVSGLTSAAAGTAQTVKVTALTNGKPNQGYRGTVVLTSTDAQAALPAPYTFTAADRGVHSFTVTLKTSGSQKVTATDRASSTWTGSQTVTIAPGPAKAFALSDPAAVTAGTAQSVTLTVRDAFNNVASGYRGTVHVTSSDAQAVLPADHAFTVADAGSHAFGVTLKTAGAQTVTVRDTATATLTATSTPATVAPASASSLTLTGLADAAAGATQSVVVTARDPYGNVATGYTGTVAFSSGDPKAVLPSNHTFTAADAGSDAFSVTLKTAGQHQSVTVTDQANPSLSASQTAAISSGPAEALDMTTDPTLGQFQGSSVTTAGQNFNVILTAIDAYGNRATGYTGTVELTSTDEMTQAGTVEFTTGDTGRVTVPGIAFFAKKIYAQHASLTAVDTGNSQINDELTFQVLPGPAVSYSCPQPTSKASNYTKANGPIGVNDDLGLQFIALDAYGNNATNRGGNPISGQLPFGYQATATVTTSDPQAVNVTNMIISGSPIFVTDPATVTLRTAGVQTVTITDPTDPSLTRTCSYKIFAPRAISGTISVPAPRTSGNETISLPASTGVAANDPITIELVSVPLDGDSPLGLVDPIARPGELPLLQWNLNPSPLPPGTLTCKTSAPCTPDGPLQIAYTIQDAFGNPPSSGLMTINLQNPDPPVGNIEYNPTGGSIPVPGTDFSVPVKVPLAGTVVQADPAAGTATVRLDSGASVNVAAVPSNSSLSVGADVRVAVQPPPLTVDGNVGSFCISSEQRDAQGNVVGTQTVCSDEFGCTSGGTAPVQLCQKSSFVPVTVIPATSDPDDEPLSLNVATVVATDVCGTVSNTDNAACPHVSLDFRTKQDGGSGLPPVGFVGLPYAFDPGCDVEPCEFFRFDAYSSRTAGEPFTFSWDRSPDDPFGLTLSEDGVLSGTPSKAGLLSFKVRVTGDLTGATDTATLTILIRDCDTEVC